MKVKTVSDIVLIILLLITLRIEAQKPPVNPVNTDNNFIKNLPKIMPPSPKAFQFGTIGELPVGNFSGTPNITIPLTNFKTKNLEIPVEISYSKNGLKVDEYESEIGLGWNINVGGIITRIVRDKPDEESKNHEFSGLITNKKMLNDLPPWSYEFQKYMYNYQKSEVLDSEDDIFYFNINGNTGKFFILNNEQIQLVNNHSLKIDFDLNQGGYDFKITDNQGVIYYFKEKELTRYRISGGDVHPKWSEYDSAWYLTSIIHPSGDEIFIKYKNYNSSFVASQSQDLSKSYPLVQQFFDLTSFQQHSTLSPLYSHNMNIVGKSITEISSNRSSLGKLIFSYDSKNFLKRIEKLDEEDNEVDLLTFKNIPTNAGRTFLEKITLKAPNEVYKFEYYDKESFPERLSFSKDHWGYFNGADNSNLVPAVEEFDMGDYSNSANREFNFSSTKCGMLKKINYPTGGSTLIEYEPNSVYEKKEITNGKTENFNISINAEENDFSRFEQKELISGNNQKIIFYGSSIFNSSACDNKLNVNKSNASIMVYSVEDSKYINLYKDTPSGKFLIGTSVSLEQNSAVNFFFEAENSKTYRVSLRSGYHCTRAGINGKYFKGTTINEKINIPMAGLRVKRTKSYRNDKDINPKIKRYYYSNLNSLNRSSGVRGLKPFYLQKRYKAVGGQNNYGSLLSITSSSLTNLFDTGNSNIYYRNVTVSHGGDNFENGGEEFQYSVNRDDLGNTFYYPIPTLLDYEFLDNDYQTPMTNIGWSNGDLLLKKTFDSDLNVVFEEKTEYETIPLNVSPQFKFRIETPHRDIYSEPGEEAYNRNRCACTSAINNYKFEKTICTTEHTHFSIDPDRFYCIAHGANNIFEGFIRTKCHFTDANYIYENFDNVNITATKYYNYSYYKYPSKIIKKYYYRNNKSLTEKTIINHTNFYPFLTRSNSYVNSLNKENEQFFFYPKDLLDGEQGQAMNHLIDQNRISEVIKSETFTDTGTDGEKTSEFYLQYDFYDNKLLPSLQFTRKGAGNIDLESNEDLKVQYHTYDSYGNPLEVSKTDGPHIFYLWGYSGQYPIAKIENTTKTALENELGVLQNVNESDLSAINDLRSKSAFKEAMITTYAYEPLVGMTVMTDARGRRTTYEYDDFGRLDIIKDHDGKLLEEYEYHYKGE